MPGDGGRLFGIPDLGHGRWQEFSLGMAPIIIGFFFFSSLQLIFLGIVGEYIGSIHTNVLNRPLVIERETINFDPQGATER